MGMVTNISNLWAWLQTFPIYGHGYKHFQFMGMVTNISNLWAWLQAIRVSILQTCIIITNVLSGIIPN